MDLRSQQLDIKRAAICVTLAICLVVIGLYSQPNYAKYHDYKYPSHQTLRIDSRALAESFISEFAERFPDMKIQSKIQATEAPEFTAYLAGPNNSAHLQKIYFYRYHSASLAEWIFSQEDNSIYPHQLFAKAIELADGDVIKALIMIHETLRNYARSLSNYVMFEVDFSDRTELYDKFVDIRGDLVERDPEKYKGDHYGSWYRLWGIILYQVVSSRGSNAVNFAQLPCSLATATCAEVVKLVMPNFYFNDRGKIRVNNAGVMTGFHLVRLINSYNKTGEYAVKPKGYLNPISSCEALELAPYDVDRENN